MLNSKDEKIFIDLDDEITFVVERIKSSDADRIILVAPDGAGVVSSLVSLKLLAKLIFKASKSLVLVTQDEGGMKFAKRAGIPVVKKIGEISEELWVESEEKLKRRGVHPILGRKGIHPESKESVSEEVNVQLEDLSQEEVVKENIKVIEEDVGDGIEEKSEEKTVLEMVSETKSEPTLEDFGFVVGKDITKEELLKDEEGIPDVNESMMPAAAQHRVNISEVDREKEYYEENMREPEEDQTMVGKDVTGYELKESPVTKILSSLKKVRIPEIKFNQKLLIPAVIFFMVLFGVGGVYAYFIAPIAEVNLKVKFETVDLREEIVATTEVGDVDLAGLKVPLILQEVEESGSDSAEVTGHEVRGEKAKGKVSLVNQTSDSIQLEVGTAITGSGFVFLLLEDTDLPGGDVFEGYTIIEVDVEAYDIGEEYNLASGTDFTVEGFTSSAIRGRSYDAFSGGTKQEVTVITANDQETLRSSLEENLKSRVQSKIREQVGDSFILNDAMIETETVEESFDANIGDEKESLNLNMKVKAKAYVYSTDDLETLGRQLLQAEVSSGLKLLEDKSEYVADFIRREDDSVILTLNVKGVISGDITEDGVKDQLSGMKKEEAESALSNLEGVEEYSITLGPDWLPDGLQHVPSIKGKLNVRIEVGGDDNSSVD